MSNKYAVSLNSNIEEEAYMEQWISEFDTPSIAIKTALRIALGFEVQSDSVAVDNSEVLNAIRMLDRKVEALTRRGVATTNDNNIPLRSDELLDAAEEAELELEQDFVVALKKAARPGMRLTEDPLN